MSKLGRAPKGVDASKPNSARVYDYLLGGRNNYSVDRLVAEQMIEAIPDIRAIAAANRQFVLLATTTAAQAGVRQFIDLGAGIPTSPAVHEMAQKIDADARVVAVDYDPVVQAHANAFLSGVPGVTPILADARRPRELIAALRDRELIDFEQPIAVLLTGVLHYVMDDEHPAEIIAGYREAMAPGSYLVLSHGSTDTEPTFLEESAGAAAGSSAQFVYRSHAEIAEYFEGFELLEPGVAPVQRWLGDDAPATRLTMLGGIARRP
ncbi:SAM-dependent methyltransferase [Nocardia pseudobrasiliensis]|uniref:S-adenosyl methyltransferase n=1 Tax=Nocardia pseudobrasiliensis TaxID=45979 RepID=A0A370I466_9NOCA|nr:SAM-dependent methyltransferase [Nocardia pseudobrasiliensis]RDI65519.1 S-adenosyl methyltransferase [Nocardia pseudobrasiliensis]